MVYGQRPNRDDRRASNLKKKEKLKRKKIRKKPCKLCADKIPLDYKDVSRLQRFVTERGKIIPRRINGNCSSCQRTVTTAVKHARQMALLAYNSY